MPVVYKTGHQIADRVAAAFAPSGYQFHDLSANFGLEPSDCHIAYGILRGTADIYYSARNYNQRFVFLDKGFIRPHHFEGYYRFGINKFQQTYEPHAFDETRLKQVMGRESILQEQFTSRRNILVIPPTEAVCDFYSLGSTRIWLQNMLCDLADQTERPIVVRYKDSETPLLDHLKDAYCVITHTSSVAWEALRHGIPSIASPACIVNGWNGLTIKDIDTDNMKVDYDATRRLFSYMAHYQFTLEEIEQGKAKHLIEGIA